MSLDRGNRTGSSKRETTRTRPTLEALEQRLQLSTFRVNTTLDTVAVNLHTGKDSSGHISLRSAIMAADAHGGSNSINVPAGMFTLTIPGANEDASASGDLDLKGTIKIKGKSSTATVIDGNQLDRVFQVLGGTVSISNLTIQNGRADQGAGILNSGGRVTLSSVRIINNIAVGDAGLNGAEGSGGGAVGGNGASGTDGELAEGGGIFNAAGSLSISNSTISSNRASGGVGGNGGGGGFGGGAIGAAGTMGQGGTGGNGGSGGEGGAGLGGGVFNSPGAKLSMAGTTISLNTAVGGAGGRGGDGFLGSGGNGGADANGHAGNGGSGTGGSGGGGGVGGVGLGGGLYNLGTTLFSGNSSQLTSNGATGALGGNGGAGGAGIGARGGNGTLNDAGGLGGLSVGGAGGNGGMAGSAMGGGIYNGGGATLTSTTGLVISFNSAHGNQGGNAGVGGAGLSFQGGNGGGNPGANGGQGGEAFGNDGGYGGLGGEAFGGGLFNSVGGTVTFKPLNNSKKTASSSFASNMAQGGNGGAGSNGGNGEGGDGGGGQNATGGFGGSAFGGNGGAGGGAGDGDGGGLANAGTASFTGVTVNFTTNVAVSGNGGIGGTGASASGGFGGNGATGGTGGQANGGAGGDGGFSSFGIGGGIHNANNASLVINPRLHAKKGSSQSKATDLITSNQALLAAGGAPGTGGSATAGLGGSPNGANGTTTPGANGAPHPLSIGAGGGIFTVATATIDFTAITGNFASSLDSDVDGTISQ